MPKRPPTLGTLTGPTRAPDSRPSSAARGYGGDWRRVRAWHLAHHPLCEDCEERGDVVEATEVDHVERLRDVKTHDGDNLRSLCKSCHSKKTVRVDGGLGRRRT
jgi:5-methylcytosine-specific restriction protein A